MFTHNKLIRINRIYYTLNVYVQKQAGITGWNERRKKTLPLNNKLLRSKRH